MRRAAPAGLPGPRAGATLALLAVAAVLLVRAHAGTPWGWRTVVAVLLAPVAVTAVVAIAGRLGGPRFAAAAGLVYVVLPFAGRRYFYGPFLAEYDHHLMPALVGLEQTGWFAFGVATAVAIVFLPERVAGLAGAAAALVAAAAWIDAPWSGLFGEFHETTWSPTLLCFLPFAATIGMALRRPWLAAAVAGPVAVFTLRGVHRPYYAGGLWLSLAAAVPVTAVLVTSLALLVPPLSRERWARSPGVAR